MMAFGHAVVNLVIGRGFESSSSPLFYNEITPNLTLLLFEMLNVSKISRRH